MQAYLTEIQTLFWDTTVDNHKLPCLQVHSKYRCHRLLLHNQDRHMVSMNNFYLCILLAFYFARSYARAFSRLREIKCHLTILLKISV